jgi:hypothetical protein
MEATPAKIKATIKWRRWIVFGLVVLLGGGVFVLSILRAPTPRIIILPLPERAPSRLQMVAEGWWWWLKVHLVGPGKSILLSASVMDLKNPPVSSNLPLPKAQYSSNGFQVWILKDRELQTLRQQIKELPGTETISSPRIQTVSGVQGAMFVGQTVPVNGTNQEVGLSFKCLPRLRREFIDLTSTLTFSEIQPGKPTAIKTNVAVRGRIQIPHGSGVLFLNTDRSQTNGKITLVTILPTLQ